ncbi:Saccharopine dehydrogenase [Streptomyces lincolnensis]|uniref:Saccharopine dehydrogenase n=1 Tax=Streptomyces lincolnensis TaxID=1915 RepID=A0A1B1M533_STRLN|nr:saccharopine dehydrogenase NADP-binding domain-containing protein [Streptomyces lincolnensis]ANS63557.1 Saccharopine dehydrogenase [Streptomyces lincolnensis]AXG52479.1 Saccharopine dehydrogenase [Streptomyces lincolnensis]QMV05434.1 NAD(P)H-binding protein [Streptomyces lincolnensis]
MNRGRTAPVAVGVVGAAGAVGRAVLEELLRLGVGPVRAAVRRPPGQALPSGAHLWPDPVDVADARALAAFCAECRVVVNATGPVRTVGHRVASAALASGADLVDVNDTAELPEPAPYARLLRWRTAVIGAGLMPGLAGLLPGVPAADGMPVTDGVPHRPHRPHRPRTLTVRVGGLPHFPPAAARDFMDRLARPGGEVTAVWRGGRRVAGALGVERGVRLPYFPGEVTAIPYLTEEAVGVARRFGLDEVRWYTVFGGEHTRAVLDRYRAGLPPGRPVDEAADELSRATLTDLAGRAPYQIVTCELDGRALVLTGTDSSALTGTTAAHAALAVLNGELPAGQLHFADLPDPARLARRIAEAPAVTGLRLLDGPLAELPLEEGIL